MGEQPIFTTKAHVFQIDPDTKKKWLPTSTQAVPVSFCHDSGRGLYRIISVESAKILVNSTIVPSMVFTKTSQKFGQWSDSRANTVYGLGFAAETDLSKTQKFQLYQGTVAISNTEKKQSETFSEFFMEKFQEVKDLARESSVISTGGSSGGSPNNLHLCNVVRGGSSGRSSPLVISKNSGSPTNDGSQNIEKLRYENDRLKIALAQSSENAKQWEAELNSLRMSNAKLTSAMQESQVNLEQWKQQLTNYRDENVHLKRQLSELEASSGGADVLKRNLAETREKLASVEKLCDAKNKELIECRVKLESAKGAQSENSKLQTKIQTSEADNLKLNRELNDIKSQMERLRVAGVGSQNELAAFQKQLNNKIHELYEMNDRLGEIIKSSSNKQ